MLSSTSDMSVRTFSSCLLMLLIFGSVQNLPDRTKSKSELENVCPGSPDCLCLKRNSSDFDEDDRTKGIEYSFVCPRVNVMVEGEIKPKEYVRILCNNQETFTDLTILKGLPDFKDMINSIPLLVFHYCQPPRGSFKELMRSIAIQNIEELHFTGSQSTGNTLNKNHLVGLENLKTLGLQRNEITDLPDDFLNGLVNLTKLDLSDNNLALSKNFFSHTTKLEQLNLKNVKIKETEEPIFRNYTTLKMLGISGSQINFFSRRVFPEVPNLEKLDIFHNEKPTALPGDLIKPLGNLKGLMVVENNFPSIPDGFFSTTPKLEELFLQRNLQPLSLPNHLLSNLTNLKKVTLYGNGISSISENTFWNSKFIKEINLVQNSLRALPQNLFQDQIHLESLELSYNELEVLPDKVFKNLISLTELDLQTNKLQNISSLAFDGLINLEYLNLGGNKLKHINSRAFQPLVKLREVLLNDNQLSSLGEEGVNFFPLSIKEIFLQDNKFEKLTSRMIKFFNESTKVTRLNLHNNPWMCDCSARDFINMLSSKRNQISFSWIGFDVTCAADNRLLLKISESEICPSEPANQSG